MPDEPTRRVVPTLREQTLRIVPIMRGGRREEVIVLSDECFIRIVRGGYERFISFDPQLFGSLVPTFHPQPDDLSPCAYVEDSTTRQLRMVGYFVKA